MMKVSLPDTELNVDELVTSNIDVVSNSLGEVSLVLNTIRATLTRIRHQQLEVSDRDGTNDLDTARSRVNSGKLGSIRGDSSELERVESLLGLNGQEVEGVVLDLLVGKEDGVGLSYGIGLNQGAANASMNPYGFVCFCWK